METGRPRAFLRQAPRDYPRDRQDKLTLQRNVQRANPYGCPVTRPPRLARPPLASPQANAGRARMAGRHGHHNGLAEPFGEISGPEIESLNYLA